MLEYMDFHLLPVFLLICFVVKGRYASQLPAERYWLSMLPKTPMPEALHNLIQQPAGNKSTISEVETEVRLGLQSRRAVYGLGYINKGLVERQTNLANSTTVYFLHTDLHPNRKMMLIFTKSANGSNFLPLKIAQPIPFSSSKFPEILNYFSVKPESKQSQILKQTIQDCEAPGVKGESKYCATSLESLVDYVIAKLGKNVEALSNEAEEEYKRQEYMILEGIKLMGEDEIVCHKKRYPYAVYYCHSIMDTKIYLVPLVGVDNGSKAKAVVVCHTNTSAWNPKHYAFQVLKVKPGGPSICHFLNSDTIAWVPKLS